MSTITATLENKDYSGDEGNDLSHSAESSSGSASYQQSPTTSFGNNISGNHSKTNIKNMSNNNSNDRKTGILQKIFDTTFRRFSIDDGYENPPHADEFDDDFDDDVEENSENFERSENTKAIKTKKQRTDHQRKNSVWNNSLIFGVLLLLCLLLWIYMHKTISSNIIYTGDIPPVCDANTKQETGQLEQMKQFSALHDLNHGAVAADHPKCSEIGLGMLQELGGNAVDAAVATALCLGVANPASSGIGGGAFILIHAEPSKDISSSNKKQPQFHDARTTIPFREEENREKDQGNKITEVIDCREVAGEKASTYMYQNDGVPDNASILGGLAVGVPGELRGLELAHARHGRLQWSTVVRPAMELARDGVPVYTHLAHDIKYFQSKQKGLGGLPTLRKLLTRDDNWDHILREGELMKNPKLAETLQAIMEEGADAMYVGDRAAKLANEIQDEGGILTKHDFEMFLPTLRSPVISDNVFGFRVVGVPPPSSGGAVIIGAIRYLAGFATPLASFADTLGAHRIVEALKHVFAIRMSMGDPAFQIGNDVTNATTHDAVEALIQGSYMEELRQASSDESMLNLSHYGGPRFAQLNDSDGQGLGHDAKEGDRRNLLSEKLSKHRRLADPFGYLEDQGTSHLSVVDKDGNAVAITTSVNAVFGAGFVSESTGILLNNQMDDFGNPGKANFFGLKPSEANFILPGKKPLSSMSPTMVFQAPSDNSSNGLGDLRMVVGGSGGPKIITAVLQVIINYLLLGKPLFESMAHPRIHNQLLYHGTASTTIENSIVYPSELNLQVSNRTKSALIKRGHRLIEINYAGTVQVVAVDSETGTLTAVCDIRKGGSPVGY